MQKFEIILFLAIIAVIVVYWFWFKKKSKSAAKEEHSTQETNRKVPNGFPYIIIVTNTTSKDIANFEVFNFNDQRGDREGILVECAIRDIALPQLLLQLAYKPFWFDNIYVTYFGIQDIPLLNLDFEILKEKRLSELLTNEEIKTRADYYNQRNKLGIQFYDLPMGEVPTSNTTIETLFNPDTIQLFVYDFKLSKPIVWDSTFTLVIPVLRANESVEIRLYPISSHGLRDINKGIYGVDYPSQFASFGANFLAEDLRYQTLVRQSIWNRSILNQRFVVEQTKVPYVKPASSLPDLPIFGFISVYVSSSNEVFFVKSDFPDKNFAFNAEGALVKSNTKFEKSLGFGEVMQITQLLIKSEDFEHEIIAFAEKTDSRLDGFTQLQICLFFRAYYAANPILGNTKHTSVKIIANSNEYFDTRELAEKAASLLFDLTENRFVIDLKTKYNILRDEVQNIYLLRSIDKL